MNDFTKEELEAIYLDMTIYAKNAAPLKESPIHLELRNKIMGMIDDLENQEPNNKENLSLKVVRHPGKDKFHITFTWEGIVGTRRMIVDVEKDSFSIPRDGVKEIRMMCDEFLDKKNYFHSFLRVGK